VRLKCLLEVVKRLTSVGQELCYLIPRRLNFRKKDLCITCCRIRTISESGFVASIILLGCFTCISYRGQLVRRLRSH
jgi:hypothetical protein